MNLRALTLIVLMATWLVPAAGYACPPDSAAVSVHEHDQGASPHSHTRAGESRSQARASHDAAPHHHPVGATAGADSSTRIFGSALDEISSCCESGREAVSAVEATAKISQIRSKSSTAALQLEIVTVAPAACLATAAQVRRQQPPPLPYEKNRRPLLI